MSDHVYKHIEVTGSSSKGIEDAVERAHGEVEQTAVVGPGVKVAGFKAAAFPRGRIGEIKPGAKPQDDDGFAVHKEG